MRRYKGNRHRLTQSEIGRDWGRQREYEENYDIYRKPQCERVRKADR